MFLSECFFPFCHCPQVCLSSRHRPQVFTPGANLSTGSSRGHAVLGVAEFLKVQLLQLGILIPDVSLEKLSKTNRNTLHRG